MNTQNNNILIKLLKYNEGHAIMFCRSDPEQYLKIMFYKGKFYNWYPEYINGVSLKVIQASSPMEDISEIEEFLGKIIGDGFNMIVDNTVRMPNDNY